MIEQFPHARLDRGRIPAYSGAEREWIFFPSPTLFDKPTNEFPKSHVVPLALGGLVMVTEWDSTRTEYHEVRINTPVRSLIRIFWDRLLGRD